MDEIPDDLFRYWQAYGRIRPFGHEPRLLATIASLLYNSHRPEDGEPLGVEAFLPFKSPPLTDEQERRMLIEKSLRESKGQ